MIPNNINAIGEIILIAFVRDVLSIVVKMSPRRVMKRSSPAATTKPSVSGFFLLALFERYAMNPGYSGSTHTAVNGAASPIR